MRPLHHFLKQEEWEGAGKKNVGRMLLGGEEVKQWEDNSPRLFDILQKT